MNLSIFLLSLDVENKWKCNTWIDWLTGLATDVADPLNSYYTHCSSFVSSVCYQLNVPMLIPNIMLKIGSEGLANKQYKWLETEGIAKGWVLMQSALEAQLEANKNNLVIACYHNNKNQNEGHVAIVCPFSRFTQEDINKYGVRICQSGWINTTSSDAVNLFYYDDLKNYVYYSHKL